MYARFFALVFIAGVAGCSKGKSTSAGTGGAASTTAQSTGDSTTAATTGATSTGSTGAGPNPCDASFCTSASNLCGSPYGPNCAKTITCSLCRYDKANVAASATGPVAAATTSGGVAFVHRTQSSIVVEVPSGMTWTPDTVTSNSGSNNGLDLAYASDGTPWVLISGDLMSEVAHKSGGSWTVEPLPNVGFPQALRIVVGADGSPYVAVLPNGTPGKILLYRRSSSGAWSSETAVTSTSSFGLSLMDLAAASCGPFSAGCTPRAPFT